MKIIDERYHGQSGIRVDGSRERIDEVTGDRKKDTCTTEGKYYKRLTSFSKEFGFR